MVVLMICSLKVVVRLERGESGWSLWTVDDGKGGMSSQVAKLEAPEEALRLWNAPIMPPGSVLAERVEGSGPYRGSKAGSIVLLRAGVLHASGGAYSALTRWRVLGSARREAIVLGQAADVEMGVTLRNEGGGGGGNTWMPVSGGRGLGASGKAVVADFTDCWILRFPRPATEGLGIFGVSSSTADLATSDPPPRYGDGVTAHSAEWILQPHASLCKDVCAGLTLRPLTAADRSSSAVARSIEGCCSWSWAGFGGLKFESNGQLVTPWGSGQWGAPPEAQQGLSGAILAEFAGHKHLLRASLDASGQRAKDHMQSTRCADNDQATITKNSGTTRAAGT